MGNGTAWGGRLPCKQEKQIGSIPIFSTNRGLTHGFRKIKLPPTLLVREV